MKHERPSQPSFNPEFPKKTQLALLLLEEFRRYYPDIIIKCVLADALYGSEEFMSGASNIFGGVQVISQLRSNQNIHDRGTKKTIQDYFNKTNKGTDCIIRVRGGEEVNATVSSGRLKVDAPATKSVLWSP